MDGRLDQMAIQAGYLANAATDELVRDHGSSPMANGARISATSATSSSTGRRRPRRVGGHADDDRPEHLGPILD